MEADTTNPGTVVDDRFVLRTRLGRGGAATVWLADDPRIGGDVALKLIHPHLRDDRRALARFGREAEVLVGLDHPHIARCFAYRLDSSRPYLAIEHVSGHSLKQELGSRSASMRHFTTEALSRLFLELCSAVAHAHDRGVLHRDLNPANVLLDTTGERPSVRVVDFGVAKLLDSDIHHATTHGRVIGTPASIAPEQALGEDIDHRADVFGLGVILFEMLTLKRAFMLDLEFERLPAYDVPLPTYKHNAPLEVFDRIVNGPRPSPREERSELPEALDEVVVRALAIEKEHRFSSVAEMEAALRAAVEGVELAPDQTYVLERRRGNTIAPPVDGASDTAVVPRRASSAAGVLVEDVAPTKVPQIVAPTVEVEAPGPAPTVELPPRERSSAGKLVMYALCFLAGVAVTAVVLAPRDDDGEAPPPAVPAAPAAAPRATPAPEPTPEPAPEVAKPVEPIPLASPKKKRRKRRLRPTPVAPPAAKRYPELNGLLERARENPNDANAVTALATGLEAAVAALPDRAQRRRMERMVSMADVSNDRVGGFAKVLRRLEKVADR